MINTNFVHLHLHTERGSLLDGLTKIADTYNEDANGNKVLTRKGLVSRVKELGQKAVAITDHGSVAGLVELYEECKKQKIGAVLGTELYVIDGDIESEAGAKQKGHHLILLAKNTKGYENLLSLNTIGAHHTHGRFPRVDYTVLKAHSEGIVILTACAAGQVYKECLNGNLARAEQIVIDLKSTFNDDFYLEIQDTNLSLPDGNGKFRHQKEVNEDIKAIANKHGVQCVATGDAHYLYKEDSPAHEVALAINTKAFMTSPRRSETEIDEKEAGVRYRMAFKDYEYHVKSRAELSERFEAKYLDITDEIVAKCCTQDKDGNWISNVHINMPGINPGDNYLMPKYKNGNNLEEFKARVLAGFIKRYGVQPDTHEGMLRIKNEIEVITRLNFVDYFLIIADLLDWARSKGIGVGIGRGSCPGSIICYCLEITDACPIRYKLYFERFLNPDRVSPPDIDLDIQSERREEIFDYLSDTYGAENVARIGTRGEEKSKSILNDVFRVYTGHPDILDENGKPIIQVWELTQLIDSKRGTTDSLYDLRQNPDFINKYQKYILPESPDFRQPIANLFTIAMTLENNTRQIGKHAAGIIVSPVPVVKHCPLVKLTGASNKSADNYVTQYDMQTIDKIGLIKIDVLGLETIDLIANTIALIRKRHNIDIDIAKINLNCAVAFKFLNSTDAYEGLFQISSNDFKGMLSKMEPNHVDDLIAGVALFRPGPLDSGAAFEFCRRKVKQIVVDHPIKEIVDTLKETHGLIIYQEQIMTVCQIVCGWTLAQADNVRKIIGKKQLDKIKDLGVKFIKDALKTLPHYSGTIIEALFEDIKGFAEYGFNRGHSAVYGITAYRTLWLKAHYPVEFICAQLTSCGNKNNYEKLVDAIKDAEKLGIKVVAPDINKSEKAFTIINDNTIAYGFRMIKGLGDKHIDGILKGRADEGEFTSFKDFCVKCNLSDVNKTALSRLIQSGCFNNIEQTNKAILLNCLEDLSITWYISATSKTKTPKRKIQSSIQKLAKRVQEDKMKVEDIHYYPYEDYTLEFHESINGFNLSEDECLARRKRVVGANEADEINMQMEVMELSFNTLSMQDIPKHLIPNDTFKFGKRDVNSILQDKKEALASDSDQKFKIMGGYWYFNKNHTYDRRNAIMSIEEYEALDMNKDHFIINPHDKPYYLYSYMTLVYGIFKGMETKTSMSKTKRYIIELTDGTTTIEVASSFNKTEELLKDIEPGNKVLAHCIKGLWINKDSGAVRVNNSLESIIKITEL